MKFSDFYALLEDIAPRELSCPWDNDGVMCRGGGDTVSRVLVSLDATSAAIAYAKENGFDTLLTHHPLIFKGIKAVTGEDAVTSRVIASLSAGINVVSLHTRLDAAQGGVNDTFAELLGLRSVESFGDAEAATLGRIGETASETTVADLAREVKTRLCCDAVRISGDLSKRVNKVALVGGDGRDFITPAMSLGADVLVTGDCSYNAAEAASEMGLALVEAGHYHTEVPVCETLATRLRSHGLECEVYDACPYSII